MPAFAAPLRIDDPRDNLEKAHQYELLAFARAHNIAEVKHDMPAILIRKILRSKRLTNIRISPRPLGMPSQAIATNDETAGIDAADDLAAQYAAESVRPPPTVVPKRSNEITDLRRECKAKGIKIARTDNTKMLREKLGK